MSGFNNNLETGKNALMVRIALLLDIIIIGETVRPL
jgi:hypothetical protein